MDDSKSFVFLGFQERTYERDDGNSTKWIALHLWNAEKFRYIFYSYKGKKSDLEELENGQMYNFVFQADPEYKRVACVGVEK